MSGNENTVFRKIGLTVNSRSIDPVYPDDLESIIRKRDDLPVLVLGESAVFCLTFLNQDGTPVVFTENDAFELSGDCNYLHGDDPLMIYADESAVNLPGDWAEADLSAGKISIRVNCNTAGFREKIGASESVAMHLEVCRVDRSTRVKSVILRTESTAKNTVHLSEPATENGAEYYTVPEIANLFSERDNRLDALENRTCDVTEVNGFRGVVRLTGENIARSAADAGSLADAVKNLEQNTESALNEARQNTESIHTLAAQLGALTDGSGMVAGEKIFAGEKIAGTFSRGNSGQYDATLEAAVNALWNDIQDLQNSGGCSADEAYALAEQAQSSVAVLQTQVSSNITAIGENRAAVIRAEQSAASAQNTADEAMTAAESALSAAGNAGAMPAGTILAFSGSVPEGYLLCDGSAVSRSVYADLFAVIGTAYGSADSTTFNLPDLRGKFLRGYLAGTTEEIGTAQAEGLPDIYGKSTSGDWAYPVNGAAQGAFKKVSGNAYYSASAGTGSFTKGFTFQASSGTVLSISGTTVTYMSEEDSPYGKSTHVTPENMAVNFIIKY